MAMTPAERQAKFREEAKARGDERINVIASKETVKRLRLYSDFNEMTQADALNMMIDRLWQTLSTDEVEAMERHAVTLEEKRKARLAGDTSTMNLF